MAEAIKDEVDTLKSNEDFVKDTNKSIDQKSLELVNKGESKATVENDLVEANKELEAVRLVCKRRTTFWRRSRRRISIESSSHSARSAPIGT